MRCFHTEEMEAIGCTAKGVHIDDKVFELAVALTPYVQAIDVLGEGNGEIIVPIRGRALDTIRLEIQSKLKKLIRFSPKKS